MEEILKQMGFANEKEWSSLVAGVPLTKPGIFHAFETWKLEDGSKEGLLKVYALAGEKPCGTNF